jgi:hypothetical protein
VQAEDGEARGEDNRRHLARIHVMNVFLSELPLRRDKPVGGGVRVAGEEQGFDGKRGWEGMNATRRDIMNERIKTGHRAINRMARIGCGIVAAMALAQTAQAVSATGGNTTNVIGAYRIHTFTSSGTFNVSTAAPGDTIQVLVVAGGGGGGNGNGGGWEAGGGGAGGLVYNSAKIVTAKTYSVTVGPGGAASTVGFNSLFDDITALGGGQGANNPSAGGSGGSGGGGTHPQTSGGSAPQGNSGGGIGYGNAGGTPSANSRGGGGGGAGGPGTTGLGGQGMNIPGIDTNYYAGGGGAYGGGSGAGGVGGGGTGGTTSPSAGKPNTGGGGGGYYGSGGTGGAGGSGIVIVKYLAAAAPTIANAVASNVTTASACMNGSLTAINGSPATLAVLWDVTDGGTNLATWANTNSFAPGQWNQGDQPTTNIASLLSPTNYYYTYVGVNASGTNVATPSQYFITGELALTATDPSCGADVTDTATFMVSRPGNCTNGALTVYYSLSGTAVNGTDYTASLASGSLVIPAGQTNATITLTPIAPFNSGAAKTITVALLPGGYVIGAAGTTTGILQHCTSLYAPWGYKAQIQFTGYNRSETLSNFPVLVVFSTNRISGFNYAEFLSGANADLRFTDSSGLVDLNYEIDTWNPASNSYVWVQVPALANTNTFIIAYWGKTGVSAPPCTTNGATWDSYYAGVWHMSQANAVDSTINTNVGTAGNNTNVVAGLTGGCQGFPGGSYITLQHALSQLSSTGLTVEAWIYPASGFDGILGCGTGGNYWGLEAVRWFIASVNPNQSYTAASGGQWHHLVGLYNGSTKSVVLDGVTVVTGAASGNVGAPPAVPYIGWDHVTGANNHYYAGLMDEVRFSSIGRSTNWLWAEYINMSANTPTFQTYGAALLMNGVPPTVANLTVSNVVAGAAFLNGQILLSPSAPVTAVTVYWGPTDGGQNAALWANTNVFAGGPWNAGDLLSTNITTFTPGQHCFYTYYASNAAGGAYATPSAYFTDGVPPTVINQTASNVVAGAAFLNGQISLSPTAPATTVTVYWGPADGGTNAAFWANTNVFTGGPWNTGALLTTNLTLTSGQDYFYTYYASNAVGGAYATPSAYFTEGSLSVTASDATLGTSVADTATVIVSRPGNCTNQSLTVYYTLGGTAVNGANYTASPASGFTFPAGQTNATITLTPMVPLNTSGSPMSIVLTLASGTYLIGAPSNATCTLASYVPSALVLDGDVYIDATDNGNVKRMSDNSVVLSAFALNTNVDGTVYNYMYSIVSLDMQGHTIHGEKDPTASVNVPSAIWNVVGSVTNGGSFDSHNGYNPQGWNCAPLRINAGGSITVSNVFTYGGAYWATGGNVYLWASNGCVHLTGYVSTYGNGGNSIGAVTIRSEGVVANQGIRIDGKDGNGHSIVAYLSGSGSEGHCSQPVGLYTQGSIQLAGGIYALYGSGVTVGGSFTNTTIRAGDTTVGGSIETYGGGPNSTLVVGDVGVVAASMIVHGAINTSSGATWQRGASVSIDVLSNVLVDLYIDTHTTYNNNGGTPSPGSVYVKARHIAINGTNNAGASIYTMPIPSSGSMWNNRMGDGDVTLTNVDTSTAWYNPKTPLTGDTSSILVSGKVVTAYGGIPQVIGNVRMSAVGVYLYGAISNANVNAAVTNTFHAGLTKYGVVTHLVENGVQWTGGAAAHNINYPVSPATNLFFTDVPYAGNLGKVGTAVYFR